MGLIQRKELIDKISPPFDHLLATQLVDSFIDMERRYIQRDWKPTTLDGGQFIEATGQILYHLDSGNLPFKKEFRDCVKYIDNPDVQHLSQDLRSVRHISKVLQTIYKFRGERGGIHISITYTPDHMDSRFLIECVRWCMNELLRVFWNDDKDGVAKAIRELLQFDVPCIGIYDDTLIVQRTDLTPEEEILIFLHYAGEKGFSRKELGIHSFVAPSTITTCLGRLRASNKRQITTLKNGNYVLTDLGHKRIREELANKLLIE